MSWVNRITLFQSQTKRDYEPLPWVVLLIVVRFDSAARASASASSCILELDTACTCTFRTVLLLTKYIFYPA